MLNFHSISIADQSWCNSIFKEENSQSSDFNFGSIFLWDKHYKQHLSRIENRIIIQLRYENLPFFAFPVGSGPLKPAIDEMRNYAESHGWKLRISGITEENKHLLSNEYPEKFEFIDDIPFYDYIYDVNKLATYSGKKLHGKKNHCNRFEATQNWRFESIDSSNLNDCKVMLDDWMKIHANRTAPGTIDEYDAILRAFSYFEQLNLFGGILYADNQVVGFSIGEKSNTDTCDIHFEKAYSDINGAYPMVCREMARLVQKHYPEVRYLNREDDMGLEHIRKSKQSYRPDYLLKKYTARFL